ncbi:MAG: hypothetical protein LBR08_06795 [Bacteroidales bacterium]|nr:hypothetical protein [Bacteroidales bacterium]
MRAFSGIVCHNVRKVPSSVTIDVVLPAAGRQEAIIDAVLPAACRRKGVTVSGKPSVFALPVSLHRPYRTFFAGMGMPQRTEGRREPRRAQNSF